MCHERWPELLRSTSYVHTTYCFGSVIISAIMRASLHRFLKLRPLNIHPSILPCRGQATEDKLGSKYTPCTLHLAPCTMHHASCTLHLALCTFPAPLRIQSACYIVICCGYLIHRRRCEPVTSLGDE